MRAVCWLSFLALASCSCSLPSRPDGGSDSESDSGLLMDASTQLDGGPLELRDGGTIIYGRGCTSPDGNKLIFILDSRTPQWCAYISMRRWDGGFPPLFPHFVPPEDFKVDEARWSACRDLELADRLDPESIPLDDLYGVFTYGFVHQGRPRTYNFDGGLRMGPVVFPASVFAGIGRVCKGN
jgi:hypothetical protein